MRARFGLYALGLASLLFAGAAFAGGTVEEAKALAEKAAVHMKDVGAEKAMADFNDPKGGYQDRDLFVFVYNASGKILAVPGVPVLLGRDATSLKDVNDKPFGKMILEAATPSGAWVEYHMTNPATKRVEPKKTYAIKTGEYVLGVGAYSP